MEQKNKPYWKESLECYLIIGVIMLVFISVIFVSAQLTGSDWLDYFKLLLRDMGR